MKPRGNKLKNKKSYISKAALVNNTANSTLYTFYIPTKIHLRFKKAAAENHISMSKVLNQMIVDYLSQ
jgi:hypothetical protein